MLLCYRFSINNFAVFRTVDDSITCKKCLFEGRKTTQDIKRESQKRQPLNGLTLTRKQRWVFSVPWPPDSGHHHACAETACAAAHLQTITDHERANYIEKTARKVHLYKALVDQECPTGRSWLWCSPLKTSVFRYILQTLLFTRSIVDLPAFSGSVVSCR